MPDGLIGLIPPPLLEELKQGRWIPIIGAGFSKNARISGGRAPLDWKELGRALSEDILGFEYDTPLDAISAHEQAFGRATLIHRVSQLLRVHDASPGAAHDAFAQLGFENVVTTNFDMLLERAYDRADKPSMPLVEEFQLSAQNSYPGPRLIKLHGDINHPHRMVLTEEDYDHFLSQHPLLATSVGALLIDHTAVLLGYSLDDPDMRQLLSVIRDRLGRLARPLWTIQIECPPHVASRYERRGVHVINLPRQEDQSYGDVLAQLLRELRAHWYDELIEESQSTDEQALASLRLPADDSRICYFAVPLSQLSIYRENLFPVVREHNMVPVAARDVLTPPGTSAAKVDALIERAALVVADISNPYAVYEAALALRSRPPGTVLVIATEGSPIPSDFASVQVLSRPQENVEFAEELLAQFRNWLRRAVEARPRHQGSEPHVLFGQGHYRAAVVAAVTLLETALTDKIRAKSGTSPNIGGVSRLFEEARRLGIVDLDRSSVRYAINLRNEVVHSDREVGESEAKEALEMIDNFLRRLEGS